MRVLDRINRKTWVWVLAPLVFLGFDAAFALTLPLPPATWGNPDQPWGRRRDVTAQDREHIAAFRSGHKTPSYATDFRDAAKFQSDWAPQADNPSSLLACRQPANVSPGNSGLSLKTLPTTACGPAKKWATGTVWSKFTTGYGFYEARIRIADISGINNAFWVVTKGYEIDIAEVHYPGDLGISLHNWTTGKDQSVGFKRVLKDDLSKGFHDYGMLWTPDEIVMEIDGEPVAAIVTHGSVAGELQTRFSTALAPFAGKVPDNPAGHDVIVSWFKFYTL